MDIPTALVAATILALSIVAIYKSKTITYRMGSIELVDTEAKLVSMLEALAALPKSAHVPMLYCDLEGVDLCRHGSISIFTAYAEEVDTVWLIDVHRLSDKSFTIATAAGLTFKDVLESSTFTKVFFDVRNDSDALFAHYGIALAGVKDLQLMECAARWGGSETRKFVTGLARCIMRHSRLTSAERHQCQQIKDRGSKLFTPDKGGRYEVFNERPLRKDMIEYCAVDVKVLPALYREYEKTLQLPAKKDWRRRVDKATMDRVKESQSAGYKPNGSHKTLSPWQA